MALGSRGRTWSDGEQQGVSCGGGGLCSPPISQSHAGQLQEAVGGGQDLSRWRPGLLAACLPASGHILGFGV